MYIGEPRIDDRRASFGVHFRIGEMLATNSLLVELYRGDGSLRLLWAGRIMDYSHFRDAEVISAEFARVMAWNAYARHAPLPFAQYSSGQLMIGSPETGASTVADLTPEQKNLLDSFIAIPFYRFVAVTMVGDKPLTWQSVDVDARSGHVMSIHQGWTLGSADEPRVPHIDAAGLKLPGTERRLKLEPAEAASSEDLEVLDKVVLSWKDSLILCRFDEVNNTVDPGTG